jgi:hypothetical protein
MYVTTMDGTHVLSTYQNGVLLPLDVGQTHWTVEQFPELVRLTETLTQNEIPYECTEL